MTPPATTLMSARPMSLSASIISGMRLRWPAASELAPSLAVNPAHRLWPGGVAAERAFERVGDFAERAAHARRLDAQRQQVGVAARALLERIERGVDLGLIAGRADLFDARDLRRAD